jgi:hypothetical protein
MSIPVYILDPEGVQVELRAHLQTVVRGFVSMVCNAVQPGTDSLQLVTTDSLLGCSADLQGIACIASAEVSDPEDVPESELQEDVDKLANQAAITICTCIIKKQEAKVPRKSKPKSETKYRAGIMVKRCITRDDTRPFSAQFVHIGMQMGVENLRFKAKLHNFKLVLAARSRSMWKGLGSDILSIIYSLASENWEGELRAAVREAMGPCIAA